MAFGINRAQLNKWKSEVESGEISFLTHYWLDPRFPHEKSVTKVGCKDLKKLTAWGRKYGLQKEWIHERDAYPHFDLIGDKQRIIMEKEGRMEELKKFL
ncbi:hypothetical protein [Fictibacillus phosphorivorans]|uniref:hypothetical protein n=1 Tax=Fictibacillus phosphorivorans TaxID=1221500 RepID=UPI00203C8A4E|nr:hypothetical protein [Fictibacillus phosphorivorans]MCM3719594.1 hypothetical protein [Fictibacillus phosphorivorans]MCM3777332.1 hypothetical protein [Fictibacillus phosphorivorans]